MATPRGKAIYARDPRWYPHGNPAAYADALDCGFIALNHFASRDEHLRQAADRGLPVLLWSHPASWAPDRWASTLDAMAERVYTHDLLGLIADPEGGWSGFQDARLQLSDQLAFAAASLPSVGVTSHSHWYLRDLASAAAGGVWASPQLYGVHTPYRGPNDPMELRQKWVDIFGDQLLPSLAAWRRDPIGPPVNPQGVPVWPPDQRSYLELFYAEQGAILWQTPTDLGDGGRIRPGPTDPGFAVLRDWQPAGTFHPSMTPRNLVARFVDRVVRPYPTWRSG